MGNAPSDEEAAVGLAPGIQQIRSTGEPVSAEGHTRDNDETTITIPSSMDAGEDAPAEGESVIQRWGYLLGNATR